EVQLFKKQATSRPPPAGHARTTHRKAGGAWARNETNHRVTEGTEDGHRGTREPSSFRAFSVALLCVPCDSVVRFTSSAIRRHVACALPNQASTSGIGT